MVGPRSRLVALLGSVLLFVFSLPASADDEKPAAEGAPTSAPLLLPAPPPEPPLLPSAQPGPRLHHAPIASAAPHDRLEIRVVLERPELVRSVSVVYQPAKRPLRAIQLLRGAGSSYLAVIPAADVQAPGLGYTLELERTDGTRVAAFASRSELQPVMVGEDRADAREKALLERLEGRRSRVSVTGEYVGFGSTRGSRAIPCAAGQTVCAPGEAVVPTVEDRYWRVEVAYTYRLLRTVAEFGLRGGVVRGQSLVNLGALDLDRYKVGLNYGSPSVRLRFADAWHLELSALSSISEVGFAVGGGSTLLIGDPYGTKLSLGFESIGITRATYFGSRFFGRLDIVVLPNRLQVAPSIEVTDMPHAEAFGVRLLGDVSLALGHGFGVGLRGGYQARRSISGGAAAGGTLSMGF